MPGKLSPHAITTFRLTKDLIARADKLIEYVQNSQSNALLGLTVSRSTVLRMAVVYGLQRLENEANDAKERTSRGSNVRR
jgi:hypothetical protein